MEKRGSKAKRGRRIVMGGLALVCSVLLLLPSVTTASPLMAYSAPLGIESDHMQPGSDSETSQNEPERNPASDPEEETPEESSSEHTSQTSEVESDEKAVSTEQEQETSTDRREDERELVAGPPVAERASGSSSDEALTREPGHRKYIVPQSDGSYDLSLEVTGDREAIAYPADIVVIFDVSLSTSASMLASFKQASQALADTLLTPANSELPAEKQVRLAIVTFATTAKTHGGFTADKTSFESYISTIGYHSGETKTNWQGALDYSDALLTNAASERVDTRKYALFLTDGASTIESPEYLNYVESEKRAIAMLNNGTTLYTLGVLDTSSNPSVFMPYIRLDAPMGDGFKGTDYILDPKEGYEPATNALAMRAYRFVGREQEAEGKYFIISKGSNQNYLDAFNEIAEDISDQIDYAHITITDVLSSYADLLDATDESGAIVGATVERIHEGVSSPVDQYSVHYDKDTKTIVFTIDESLVHQTTYRLTVAIGPSQAAFDELAANRFGSTYEAQDGYPHTGEAGTGDASEDRFGFFSNDAATLLYHTVDKQGAIGPEEAASPFEKPVIQAPLGSISVQKQWVDDVASDRSDTVEITLLQDGSPYRSATLSEASGWQTVFGNIPGGPNGHTYTLEESPIERYEASYAPGSMEYQGLTAQTSGSTITNTRLEDPVAQLSFFKISNVHYQEGQPIAHGLSDAAFELYAWTGQGVPDDTALVNKESIDQGLWTLVATASSQSDGLVELSFSIQREGLYQLVETTSPQNYQLPLGQWRMSFTAQGHINSASITQIAGSDGSVPPFLQVRSEAPYEGELTLINIPNYELPAMGGSGTDVLRKTGLALVVLALSIYGTKKIREKRNRLPEPKKWREV